MNPIHARFSTVEKLRHSDVDIQSLKSEGQLEVNGKRYEIRAAGDGTLTVLKSDQQLPADKFFKNAANFIGRKDHSAQIAQVLNEKVASTPRLNRMLGRRIDPEAGGSSSVNSAVRAAQAQLSARQAFASLKQWAEVAEARGFSQEYDIYMLYSRHNPVTAPMSETEQTHYFNTLQAIDKDTSVIIRPQAQDRLKDKKLDLGKFIAERSDAKDRRFRMEPRPERKCKAHAGRLAIAVEPKYGAQLAQAMATLMENNTSITQGKLAGPALYGQQTDSAILYINGDSEDAARLGEELKELSNIPAEAFLDHKPFSMLSLDKGLFYAETAGDPLGSYGMSLTHVIMDALKRQGPLEKRLEKALIKAGYNPENPALRRRK